LPQLPQFAASVATSTQRPSQSVPPAMPHIPAHAPAEQTCPPTQALPQVPQFSGSFRRSAHVDVLHVASGAAHVTTVAFGVHSPAEQNSPTAQPRLQAPQFDESFRRSAHTGTSAPQADRGEAQRSPAGMGADAEPHPKSRAIEIVAARRGRVMVGALR
jgi:hypothetical protein